MTASLPYTDGRLYSILYNQPNRGFEYTETYDYVGSTVTISRISTDGNSKIKYDNGRLILIERNNNTFTYQYEFDNHGNLDRNSRVQKRNSPLWAKKSDKIY